MKKRKALIILLLVLLAAICLWFFYWNKPKKSIEDVSAISVTATSLFQLYNSNETQANNKYTNKVVAVTGAVETVSKNTEGKTVVLLKSDDLMFGVNCTLEKESQIKAGETVTLKGICTGYLTDVIVIRCYKLN